MSEKKSLLPGNRRRHSLLDKVLLVSAKKTCVIPSCKCTRYD